jgi:hypothetical protein
MCTKTTFAKVPPLSYTHIAQTARDAGSSHLFTLSAIDPGVPSIGEILTLAASEACDQIGSANDIYLEYLIYAILVLGGYATHDEGGDQILDNQSSRTACQEKCLYFLTDLLPSGHQNIVFQAVEKWLEETSLQAWVMHCGAIICPYAARRLYEYSIDANHKDSPEEILRIIHIMRYFSMIDGDLGAICMQSTVPILVRIAGNKSDKNVSSSSIACLLGMAKGKTSSSMFRNIVSNLSEKDRTSLHAVLASGTTQTQSENQGLAKDIKHYLTQGLHSLDLSRFN